MPLGAHAMTGIDHGTFVGSTGAAAEHEPPVTVDDTPTLRDDTPVHTLLGPFTSEQVPVAIVADAHGVPVHCA